MKLRSVTQPSVLIAIALCPWVLPTMGQDVGDERQYLIDVSDRTVVHGERPADAWTPGPRQTFSRGVAEPSVWTRGPYRSVQVNVDALGQNIVGDAANEPSIAIAPTDTCKMAIGWRQFDTIESDFRQAGWAYSYDRGETWTFTGSLEPGTFGSDPVLDADGDGSFYYLSMADYRLRLFRSLDGGVTWDRAIADGLGFSDKPWMAIDRTDGIGRGNIYITLHGGSGFTRSTDGGGTFVVATEPLGLYYGTMSVAPGGELFAAGFYVAKSVNAQDPDADVTFDRLTRVGYCVDPRGIDHAGPTTFPVAPTSPCGGILVQDWAATDHSTGPDHGNVYVLAGEPCSEGDPMDVMFIRSTDGGIVWDPPLRVNDDPEGNYAWQWFNTMSVAPNGRIDVVWNDTRNSGVANLSELFYAYSTDAGETWSKNRPVSPMFDSCIGMPVWEGKIGDYYDMISDNAVANVAYAATFNGEQDVYFLRVGDCNDNGIHDSTDLADGTAYDCNENALLDECERGDLDGNEQINLYDFAGFATCYTGSSDDPPAAPPLYADRCCGIMDFDTDGDIDLTDFAAFHEAFSRSE